ncbi:MAG: S1 RNA-binding domain-containing protein [Deferrisomatales bacterium]
MDETTRPDPETPTPAAPSPASAPAGEPAPAAAEGETTQAFAELLAGSGGDTRQKWNKGDKLKATVVALSGDWVFVSLGGKEEGTIRVTEFTEPAPEGQPAAPGLPAVGDQVEAYVLSASGGEVVLTTRLGRRDASLSGVEAAWHAGIPLEGRIGQTVKGGYEVRVSGLRAFCPLSQVDLRWPRNPDEHVGQTYLFKVIEFKEKGRNIILSRRALLEEERVRQRDELRTAVVPGAVVTGTVRSLQSFGAFVDLGGVDALIPISEMSWGRIESPSELLGEGQQITAKVLTVDWEKNRLSLSLKAMEGDPWEAAARTYQPGQRVKGTVARLAAFGAFVTLEPGVDGLVHISALGAGRRVKHPKEVLQVGEVVEADVLGVDLPGRKISLSLEHRHLDTLGDLPQVGSVVQGTVENVAEFGVFVKVPSGHTGLVPNVEMGTPKGTDHGRMFKPGAVIEVSVLDVEDGGRRIRLSRKATTERKEEADAREYRQVMAEAPTSMGTLGDLLRAKLKDRK